MNTAANTKRVKPSKEERRSLAIIPPEGVPLTLRTASLSVRASAQIVDVIITLIASALVLLTLGLLGSFDFATAQAVASLVFLLIGTPYYVIAELLANGRTPGKRLLGIRVVSADGQGLSVHQIVVRNLMKEIEIFTPLVVLLTASITNPIEPVVAFIWFIIVMIIPIASGKNQRLGDIIAGTAVISNPSSALLPDLANARVDARERFVFTPQQMDLYGAYELQVLERLLRGARNEMTRSRLADVAMRIRRKIGYEETVAPHEEETFLHAFYTAQRGYLEQKKLFGEARADKRHADTPSDTG